MCRLSRLLPAVVALCAGLAAPPLGAEEAAAPLRLGGDLFAAGGDLAVVEPGFDDVVLAGDNARLSADIGGTALMAGRRVGLGAPLAGDIYAAGFDVTLGAAVGGDATLAGHDVTAGAVAGDLRATGRRVTLAGPVAGYASIAADRVTIDAPVTGDLALAVRSAVFGPGARVDGEVLIIGGGPDDDRIEIPAHVAPAERVRRIAAPDHPGPVGALPAVTPGDARDGGFPGTILRLALLVGVVTLAATLLPATFAGLRARLVARPAATTGLGALAFAALAGSVVLLAMTLIGLVLVPLVLLALPLAALAGYVVGLHVLGVVRTDALGLPIPTTAAAQARAALAGVVAMALAGLVPLLGWLAALALTLAGLGAVVARMRGPRAAA